MRVLKVMLAVAWLALGIESRAATHIVRMANFSFTPSSLTVDVGDTVIWTNTVITSHDTVCQGVWASRLLARAGTFSFTFNVQPRIYNYVCSPHVSFGMVGSITVRAPVNNAPTVSFVKPVNGQELPVGTAVEVEVKADDDNGVSKVDLFVDGAPAGTDTSSLYQFTVPPLSAGNHTLLARATDAAGLTGDSSINILVKFATPPPTVTLTSPTNNARFNEPATVTFSARVESIVERVEFLTNGVVMATDTTEPYTVTNILAQGAYTVMARAIGTDTQIGNSVAADIEVGEHIPEPPKVSITTPVDGDNVAFEKDLLVRAVATDDDSPIASISIVTPSGVETVTNANQFDLITRLPEGIHTLFATAQDTTGLIATSAPISITVQMVPLVTYAKLVAPGVLRLGFYGSSGLPYVFGYTTNDNITWIPVKTNVLYRRIFFFNEIVPINEPVVRIYTGRRPGTPPPPPP